MPVLLLLLYVHIYWTWITQNTCSSPCNRHFSAHGNSCNELYTLACEININKTTQPVVTWNPLKCESVVGTYIECVFFLLFAASFVTVWYVCIQCDCAFSMEIRRDEFQFGLYGNRNNCCVTKSHFFFIIQQCVCVGFFFHSIGPLIDRIQNWQFNTARIYTVLLSMKSNNKVNGIQIPYYWINIVSKTVGFFF